MEWTLWFRKFVCEIVSSAVFVVILVVLWLSLSNNRPNWLFKQLQDNISMLLIESFVCFDFWI